LLVVAAVELGALFMVQVAAVELEADLAGIMQAKQAVELVEVPVYLAAME
jgi:hypothetical protein